MSSDTKVRDALALKALETAKKDQLDDLLDRRALAKETAALTEIKKELEAAEVKLKNATDAQAQYRTDAARQTQDARQKSEDEDKANEAKKAVDAKRSAVVEGEKKVSAEQKKYEDAVGNFLKDVTATGIQVGWTDDDARRLLKAEGFDFVRNWVSKIIGLMLSAFALSLGAPFWFDLLKKVASIRAVGLDLSERAAKAAKPAGG